ncbi:MAG: Uma2 family endonuclease [Pirellulales bacterium]
MATVLPSTAAQVSEAPVPLSPTATEATALEVRVLLQNVSWDTYEKLVEEIVNPGTRLAYDEGLLEIMSPLERHDRFKELLGRLVDVVTEELDMSCRSTGSTTWRRKKKKKGLEADKSYYLTNAPKVRGKREVDLNIDPPPDLAIEVENTSSALDQLGIYAALGIPEVWRFDGEILTIHGLQANGQYAEQTQSQFFSRETTAKMVEWIGKCDEGDDEIPWIKEFRRWVRENLVISR